MDVWIDCMSYLDDADAGATAATVVPGELFHLEVADRADFRKRLPAARRGGRATRIGFRFVMNVSMTSLSLRP
jgi:hypothetical protein